MYVWFDAMVSFLSQCRRAKVLDENLRIDPRATLINVVGKDIVKFLSIKFPIVAQMASIQFDHQIVCHEHWLKSGKKMSKSYGNVVDPFEMIKSRHTLEQLKLYFIVFGPYARDADFCHEESVSLYNKFVDNIVSCYLKVFSDDCLLNTEFSSLDSTSFLKDSTFFGEVERNYTAVLDSVDFRNSPETSWNQLLKYYEFLNNSLSKEEPWKVKDPVKKSEIVSKYVLSLCFSIPALYMFVPEFSRTLGRLTGLSHLEQSSSITELVKRLEENYSMQNLHFACEISKNACSIQRKKATFD